MRSTHKLRLSRKQFDSVVSVLGRIADALESDRFVVKANAPDASAPSKPVLCAVCGHTAAQHTPPAPGEQKFGPCKACLCQSFYYVAATAPAAQAPPKPTVHTIPPKSDPLGPQPIVPEEGFHIAESGEEYEERVHHERALALSLGVAPWSPDFQEAIDSMRRDIMKRQIVQVKNEETGEWNWVPKQFSEEEADQIVREAFQLAKAEANVRRETGDAHRVA